MSNKKGFTLVELLAVIAILAILVLIAMPNVLNMFMNAKKSSFVTEAQNVIKQVTNKYIDESLKGNHISTISNDNNPLDLSGNIKYEIEIDSQGNVLNYIISNDSYCISSSKKYNELTKDDVKDDCNNIEKIEGTVGTLSKDYFKIASIPSVLLVNSVTFYSDGRTINSERKYDVSENQDGKIMMYVVETGNEEWFNINSKSSTVDLIIVADGKIDLPEDSSSLFSFYTAPNHGPESNFKSIEFNNSVETKNVTNMSCMFCLNRATKYDLTGFDTSKVTDMSYMFEVYNFYEQLELNLSSFDTSNVTNMESMFRRVRTETLDLSNFDISEATNVNNMFWESRITNAYAKNELAASKFNSSTNKTDTINFIVR